MVAEQLRTVFHPVLPRPRGRVSGRGSITAVIEVWVVAGRYEDEDQSPDGGADSPGRLPFRETGADRPVSMTPIEARAETRDRETYYTELRFAVHCQSRSIPLPRAALDNQATDTPKRRPDDESWDDMTARFGDTWT